MSTGTLTRRPKVRRSSPKPLRLGLEDHGRPLSHAGFASAQFDEPWRYERVQGRLIVMAPSGEGHVSHSEPFRDQLGAFKLAHPDIVERVVSEAWVFVDDGTERIADIGVYLMASKGKGRIPKRIPELVFEVVSEGSDERDYVTKRTEYERAGVREYVIVDPRRRRVTVLRRVRGGGFRETRLGPDDSYSTPSLPGLRIPLAKIL
jgi:Uma2 family endonuclease